jgi:hypothetical protein
MDAQRVDANSQHPAASPVLITDRQAAIFQLKMFAGRPGKANLSLKAALLNAPVFDVVTHRVHFEKLFPKRDSLVPLPVPPYFPVVNIEDEQVMASLKKIANGASADLFGFTGDALHLVSSQPAHIKHLTKLVSHIANNKLDNEVADVFRATKLIALPKKEFVPRPLGNCCVFPKLAADILMNRVKSEVKSIVGDLQRAVGTPDGVASTIHNSQLLLEYLPQDAGLRAALEVVVFGLISPRDEGSKAAGAILHIADHRQVLNPLGIGLAGAHHECCGGFDSQSVRDLHDF